MIRFHKQTSIGFYSPRVSPRRSEKSAVSAKSSEPTNQAGKQQQNPYIWGIPTW